MELGTNGQSAELALSRPELLMGMALASQQLLDPAAGYALAQRYLGDTVKVYLTSGSVLMGLVEAALGKFVVVIGEGKEALINLDHTTSLTRNIRRA